MKVARTENAVRNVKFGLVLKLYQILSPFALRTAILYSLGTEYLGLGGLFGSILRVLSLAELGFGGIMVYSMYRPIAEDDEEQICALMRLYRSCYRVIGLVVLVLGFLVMPLLPRLIKGGVPEGISLRLLYLLNLSATVASYWLFAYQSCLLNAHQRVDVTSRISFYLGIFTTAAQIVSVVAFRNYYLCLTAGLVGQAASNCLAALASRKMFPRYSPRGDVGNEKKRAITRAVRDAFTARMGGVVLDSADAIVISAFLGLTTLAVYQNYFGIVSAIIGVFGIFFNAGMAGIGNSLVTESKEKNYRDLVRVTFFIVWLASVCSAALLALFQPFMELWVGERLMLGYPAVISFAIYFFVYEVNRVPNLFKDAAGLWHEDRFRPLVTAMLNLGLNLLTVRRWGIYGVLFSTVAATLFVGMPWLFHNLFAHLFGMERMKDYVRRLAIYTAAAGLAASLSVLAALRIRTSPLEAFLIRGGIVAVMPNAVLFFIFRKGEEFADMLMLLDRVLKGRLPFPKRRG